MGIRSAAVPRWTRRSARWSRPSPASSPDASAAGPRRRPDRRSWDATSGNTIAAAEHTMAMMLALARHIPQADQAVKAGRWERSRFLGNELRDKVLGVVGLGNIGREVAHRAQAFGMRVIATDPVLSEERASQLNVRLVPLEQLLSEADLISLHVPLTRETHHLIDARALATTKPG